jgi:hypothetical protein
MEATWQRSINHAAMNLSVDELIQKSDYHRQCLVELEHFMVVEYELEISPRSDEFRQLINDLKKYFQNANRFVIKYRKPPLLRVWVCTAELSDVESIVIWQANAEN